MARNTSAYERHDELRSFAVPCRRKGWIAILTSAVPYLALFIAAYLTLGVSVPLTVVLELLSAAFLVRAFVVFHDCTHGSLLPTMGENTVVGTALGLLLVTPFYGWRHEHAVHHATAGDLDRRGIGDVTTMTVNEYHQAPFYARIGYRMFRNPLVMFGLGPIFAMIIAPRVVPKGSTPRVRNSILMTNVAVTVIIGGLCLLMGWRDFLLVWGAPALVAGAAGVWLFYVQHQFEDAYWKNGDDWSYTDAALRGSSYLKLPAILNFFSANIGLHHVHHLNPRIPSYNLQQAHAGCPVFASVPVLTVADGIRSVRLKLWDEDSGQLVTFEQARKRVAQRKAAAARPLAART
jgi:acyl-lipid omega-6 desaturase (Delta-12 desaturase)